jgi:biotin carboxyl carrier protein
VKLYIEIAGKRREIRLETADDGAYRAIVDGEERKVDVEMLRAGIFSLLIDGRAYRVVAEETPEIEDSAVYVGRERFAYRMEDPRSLRSRRRGNDSEGGPRTLKASMPGRVVRILVTEGDRVSAGKGVLVLEAMKMQNEVKSPKDGTVARLLVAPGEAVGAGQDLAVIE